MRVILPGRQQDQAHRFTRTLWAGETSTVERLVLLRRRRFGCTEH